jgi:SWI/SNF-related matrix-associated actin-dependent regulator of chromatin subfamily A3
MGLGKSLTTISLICTIAPGGPMTLPDPEEATQPAEKEDERAPKRQRRSQAATSSKKKGNASKSKPTPKPSIAAATSPTLILCPLSVMAGWEQQFEDHTAPGALKVHTYHGANRDRRVPFLSGHHVVISTYSTLAAEFRESARNGLLGVKWFRVVADEGHVLKNPKTQTAQAARKLKTERRWIISGTPIQNSLKDLHGLLGFLKLEPLTERALFRRTIERPVAEGNPNGVKRLQALVGALALRRTKETHRDGRPLVTLPRKSVFEVPVELDGESRAKYDRWFAASMRMIQHHLAENTLLENFTAVLTMILRLRQLAADPSLVSEEDPMLLELFKTSSSAPATCLDEETRERLLATLRAGLEGEVRRQNRDIYCTNKHSNKQKEGYMLCLN